MFKVIKKPPDLIQEALVSRFPDLTDYIPASCKTRDKQKASPIARKGLESVVTRSKISIYLSIIKSQARVLSFNFTMKRFGIHFPSVSILSSQSSQISLIP